MTKKAQDDLRIKEDSVMEQLTQLWEDFNVPNSESFKIQVNRLEPSVYRGLKISGYLETYYLPTTVPDIIEKVGVKYGGGKYTLRIIDESGKIIKSKTFDISGNPIFPKGTVPEIEPVRSFGVGASLDFDDTSPVLDPAEARKLLIRLSFQLLKQPETNKVEIIRLLKDIYKDLK